MKALFLLLAVAVVFGCSQNPYPKDGKILVNEPEGPNIIPPPFVLDIPLQIELAEGTSSEIQVRASVPKPGLPVVSFKNLPAGATFDSTTMKLVWNPDFQAGNDVDPHLASRTYQITGYLRSSLDPVTTIQRVSNLTVRDTPRAFTVSVEKNDIKQKEGETVRIPLRISSEDFAKGPFRVLGLSMPAGAEIKSTSDESLFHLVFGADYETASVDDYQTAGIYYRPMKANVAVELPSGRMATLDVNWDVIDVRQDPQINAPATLSAGLDANFTVTASDPNGEAAPKINFTNPTVGKIKVSNLNFNRASYVTMKGVRWTDVPAEYIGKTLKLDYEVCVKNNYYSFNRCVKRSVDVTFNPDQYPAPTIDRAYWPMGIVKYVKEGDTLTVPMNIKDPGSSNPKVEIYPKEAQEEVSWVNGKVTVTPKKAGIRQFNITAVSGYGVKSQESFLVETLPSSWSKVLVLGESHKVSELVKTGSLFDDAQYANPMLQTLDGRMLALRSVLVITTSAMKDATALPEIEAAAKTVRHVIIMSPLANQFASNLATELTNLKVGFDGRFLDQTGLPELKTFQLIAETDSGLKTPVFPVRLGEAVSDESKNPLILKVEAGSPCKTLLTLRKEDLPNVFPMTVFCTRQTAGNLLVSGFEWADAVPSASDQKLIKEWMTKLVTP